MALILVCVCVSFFVLPLSLCLGTWRLRRWSSAESPRPLEDPTAYISRSKYMASGTLCHNLWVLWDLVTSSFSIWGPFTIAPSPPSRVTPRMPRRRVCHRDVFREMPLCPRGFYRAATARLLRRTREKDRGSQKG